MRTASVACACAAAVVLAAPASAGQRDPRQKEGATPSPFIELTRAAWYNVNDLVLGAAGKMPAEHYAFQPTKQVRTFAQILVHIAADHHAMCGPLVGRTPTRVNTDELDTKEEISKHLRDSSAMCDLAFGMLNEQNAGFRYRALDGEYTRAALLLSVVTHDSEHYGNLVTYMRLQGIVPPSSQR